MADIPPTVRAADILNALGSASIVDVPPAAPQTISASQVQSVVAANTIAVGDFTAKDRARAAVHLTYFVGGIISFVILMVFLDYLTHMPTTPDNLATHQPVQQASPAPALPSPQGTPAIQQTTFIQKAAFSKTQAAQATPVSPGAPKTAATPSPGKTPLPEATPVFQVVTPKTPEENYVFVSNAIADRSSKMFDLIVVRALLPVFTALLGYIFGSQPSRP